ncbi:MAG: ribose 5-phosphate isomerase B [Bacillota bacterium]
MIYIGCDQGGLALKNELIPCLSARGLKFKDIGTFTAESVDYPDIAETLCRKISGQDDRGILICGTGIGMSISANKMPGIRAALCHDTYSARMARAHNNANVLVMGGRVIGPELAKEICGIFFSTGFDGGRHAVRVEKIMSLGSKNS